MSYHAYIKHPDREASIGKISCQKLSAGKSTGSCEYTQWFPCQSQTCSEIGLQTASFSIAGN
jgi:hypothetical protein